MRKTKSLSLIAAAAFAASAQFAIADTSLFSTEADFGGSNLAGPGVAHYNIDGVASTAAYSTGYVVNGVGTASSGGLGLIPTAQTLGYNSATSTVSSDGQQIGWEGFGTWHFAAGANDDEVSDLDSQGNTVAFVASSLGNAGSNLNGIGNYSNDFNAAGATFSPSTPNSYPTTPTSTSAPSPGTSPGPFNVNGTDPFIGTSYAGRAGTAGAVVIKNYSGASEFGGESTISTGEMESGPNGANNGFIKALAGSNAIAIDYTAQGGGTTPVTDGLQPSPYFLIGFSTGDSTTAGGFNTARYDWANFGNVLSSAPLSGTPSTAFGKDVGLFGDQPGSFVVKHGTGASSYFTAYLPYGYAAAASTTFLQFELTLNADGFNSGDVTIDNIRTISPQWAAGGSGISWNTGAVLAASTSPNSEGQTITSQGAWIGAQDTYVDGSGNTQTYGLGVPHGSGVSVEFGDLETGNATIGLDTNQMVGTLIIDTTTDNSSGSPIQYNLAAADSGTGAGGSLVMDNTVNSLSAAINDITGSPIEYITAPVILNSNTVVTVGNATNTLFFGSDSSGLVGGISGVGSLTVAGSGTVQLFFTNTYGGGTTVNAGATLVASSDNALPSGKPLVNNGTTDINGNATLSALTGTGTLSIGNGSEANIVKLAVGSGLATQSGLTINATSTLDIGNNHMILSYGATDPASTIYNYLKTGYNGGAWSGVGIDSSVAALPANKANYGVGFVDGKDGVPGATVTSGQILIAYALYGDVNLDGLVNATDFAVFGANFNSAVTGWDKGDFTYTGLINATDFALLGANFGKSASGTALSLPESDFAALDAFAAANGLSLASVPEPTTAALFVVAGMGMLGKRRRKI